MTAYIPHSIIIFAWFLRASVYAGMKGHSFKFVGVRQSDLFTGNNEQHPIFARSGKRRVLEARLTFIAQGKRFSYIEDKIVGSICQQRWNSNSSVIFQRMIQLCLHFWLESERSQTVRPGRPSRTEKWVELNTPVWTIGSTGSVEVAVELRSFANHHQ